MLFRTVLALYNLGFPLGFLLFLPGLIWKYRHRGGYRETFGERFGRFTPERVRELAEFRGAIWIHAVSVGETVVALNLLRRYREAQPQRKFVFSTGTTTGQELARKQVPPGVAVIFAPIDWRPWVRRTLALIQPVQLVIFETEIWPNLIVETRKQGGSVVLVNARLSDHSARGYRRARCFFRVLLAQFSRIAAQSAADAERLRAIAPGARVEVTGNLKFDQQLPAELKAIDYPALFGGPCRVLLAASTHPGEEALLIRVFGKLRGRFEDLRLVLVPRHAERGPEVVRLLHEAELPYLRRSTGEGAARPQVLLADTTGELLTLMAGAEVVVMGKSFAGQNEGHNLIEPALLARPVVTGVELRNFRPLLRILQEAEAVRTARDEELSGVLGSLLADPAAGRELGLRAQAAVSRHAGALERTLHLLIGELPEEK